MSNKPSGNLISESQSTQNPTCVKNMSIGGHLVGALGTIFILFGVLPVFVWLIMKIWDFIF